MLRIRPSLFLYLECITLTLLVPIFILEMDAQRYIFPILWLAALYCLMVGWWMRWPSPRAQWRSAAMTRATLRPMLGWFALNAALLALATWLFEPESLFRFVRSMPWLWAMVMVAYPLLSVIAQEIIYRWFFFARYATLFPNSRAMILASALTFGFGHVIFGNWVAPLLTVIGGVLFSITYARHRSLALVSLEHALYGNFIFTIGLGWYFFHARV